MPQLRLPYQWNPRAYQALAWDYLEAGGTRAVLCWHRRSGKDEVGLHWTAVATHRRVGTYWHMLPEASQARKAIWEAVNPHTGKRRIDEAFPEAIREVTHNQEMFIRFKNGSTWQVVGSDNYDSLVGSPPIGVVMSEWSLADPAAWSFLRPILAENGGWAIFVFTPRGHNHAERTLDLARMESPRWFGQLLTVDDTHAIPSEVLATELRELIQEMGVEEGKAHYQQEYMCSFAAAMPGAIYAPWIEEADKMGRITLIPPDPRFPLRATWDLGYNDSNAMWFFQDIGFQTRFLRTYDNRGQDLQHYVKEAKDLALLLKLQMGSHVLPHDVEHHDIGILGGHTRKQILINLGLTVVVAPRMDPMERSQAGRDLLKTCAFDREGCGRGLDALRHYHRKRDEARKTFLNKPEHDWSSHYADSFGHKATEPPGEVQGRYHKRPIVKQKWR